MRAKLPFIFSYLNYNLNTLRNIPAMSHFLAETA